MAVPVVWVGGEDLPTIKVNQFLVQVDGAGDVFVTVGTLTPPVLLGDDPDELRKQAESISHVPIRTVARFALSGRGLRELAAVLQNGIEIAERQEAGT